MPASETLEDTLERLIDGYGLPQVLEAMARVCADKAAHIEQNWQDKPLARVWTKAGDMIESGATKARERGL